MLSLAFLSACLIPTVTSAQLEPAIVTQEGLLNPDQSPISTRPEFSYHQVVITNDSSHTHVALEVLGDLQGY